MNLLSALSACAIVGPCLMPTPELAFNAILSESDLKSRMGLRDEILNCHPGITTYARTVISAESETEALKEAIILLEDAIIMRAEAPAPSDAKPLGQLLIHPDAVVRSLAAAILTRGFPLDDIDEPLAQALRQESDLRVAIELVVLAAHSGEPELASALESLRLKLSGRLDEETAFGTLRSHLDLVELGTCPQR